MCQLLKIRVWIYLLLIGRVNVKFANVVHPGGYCKDTESVLLRDDNKTLILSRCKQIFPLQASAEEWKINHLIVKDNKILMGEMFKGLSSVKTLELIDNEFAH